MRETSIGKEEEGEKCEEGGEKVRGTIKEDRIQGRERVRKGEGVVPMEFMV
ncbi:uncharacterized protein DS421_11g341400 [Arachis hypogaea]|nr:uncharacterized protein DS421_11g341400 [Arachis hypogaea]